MQSKTTTFSLVALSALLAVLLLWRVAAGDPEKKALQAQVATLSRELAAAQPKMASVPTAAETPREVKPSAAMPVKPSPETAQRAASSVTVTKLNEELAAARARISELESKVLSLDADRATLTQQRQQELTAADQTCRTRIAETQRSLESAQTDLKAAQQRATLFETENENLRKAQAASAKTAARAPAAVPEGELDELSRRRDGYLKSLLRRYREIDADYRAFMRDPQGPHTTDPALLRIQATLSQAEEDLRQIDSLNAKTLLVEKRRDKN